MDLSHISPKIVPFVSEMAAKFYAEVHLLFVARILQHFSSIDVPHSSINKFKAEIVEGAERRLQEFLKVYFKGGSCRAEVVSGDPAEEILN